MNHLSFSGKLSGFLLIALSIASSCSRSEEIVAPTDKEQASKLKSAVIVNSNNIVCNEKTSALINKNQESAGTVKISTILPGPNNTNGGNIVVSVYLNEKWIIKSIQMFVGNKEDMPMASNDYPIFEIFPVNVNFSYPETSFSYEFSTHPTSTVQVIAVHAYLKSLSKNNLATQTNDFWIDGISFTNQKWGSYYNYIKIPCSQLPPTQ